MKKLIKSHLEIFEEQAEDMGITKGTPRYLTAKQFFAFGIVMGKASVKGKK